MTASSKWIPATRSRPCPVCKKGDWCGASGDLVVCMRQDAPSPAGMKYIGRGKSGGYLFAPLAGSEKVDDSLAYDPAIYVPPVVVRKRREPPAKDWSGTASRATDGAADALAVLAGTLGVTVDALAAMGVGHDPGGRHGPAWSFPMRDAAGTVVGISDRFESPAPGQPGKKTRHGGRNGLFYAPDRWRQGDFAVYIVEGGSDTAALIGIGLAVIGRPSSHGGADDLAEMLADWPDDRGVVVVAERDAKPDGRWPGREGAVAVATKLAEALRRPMAWTLPPEPFKDARDLVQSGATAEDVAYRFATAARVIPAPPPPVHEDATLPAGEVRSLAEYREALVTAKHDAIRREGIHVDRSPTGAGKTRSTIMALLDTGFEVVEGRRRPRPVRSVTALPTHANVRERYDEMLAAGHSPRSVGTMPELSEDNCGNYDAATAARAAGLSHGPTVCRTCPHRKGCEFLSEAGKAKRRQHLITTHEHYRRSSTSKYMRERRIVVIDERPHEVVAPMLEAGAGDIRKVGVFFAAVASEGSAAVGAVSFDKWTGEGLPAHADLAASVANVAPLLADLAHGIAEFATERHAVGEHGVFECPVDPAGTMPEGWERFVPQLLARQGVEPPPAEALRLVVAIAEGLAPRAWVSIDTAGGDSIVCTVFTHWRTNMYGKRVLLLDGTADAETLAGLAGEEIVDITPAGRLPGVHPVVQLPIDITRATGINVVRGMAIDLIERATGDVGLIGHQKHIRALTDPDGPDRLPDRHLRRVAMATWFGAGPDRASNAWHVVCPGGVLVLGTPRVPSGAVRRAVAMADLDAARRDGCWGQTTWDATTADGGTVTLRAKGYADPAWRRAHHAAVRAAMLQAVGRARAGLPEGVPCTVLSTEPLGLAVDLRQVVIRLRAVQDVLDALVDIVEAAGRAATEGVERFTVPAAEKPETTDGERPETMCQEVTPTYLKELLLLGKCGHFVGASFFAIRRTAIIAVSGKDADRVAEALVALADEGAAHNPEHGFWAIGPAPAEPVAYVQVSDGTELGRPPEVDARVADTSARVRDLAAGAPGGTVTTAAFADDQARRSAERRLAEAVTAGEVVPVVKGHYAPAGQRATWVSADGMRAVDIVPQADGTIIEFEIESTDGAPMRLS